MMHWEIEPYHNNEADICEMPADNPDDHRKALEYAQKRLEELWDLSDIGEEIIVKMTLCVDIISTNI